MKKIIYLSFCFFACLGCEYDYDLNDDIKNFKPKVVVNGVINPDSTIKVELFWTKHHTENIKDDYKRVAEFDAELYENGTLIKNEECLDGEWETEIYPKEGNTYNIKFTIPNYGEVKAETYVPIKAEGIAKYAGKNTHSREYYYVSIEQISPKDKMRAIWLKTYGEYKRENGGAKIDFVYEPYDYYSNNIFADQVNATLDTDKATDKGSPVIFDEFIRIPYLNITPALPVDFSTWISSSSNAINTDEDLPVDEFGNIEYYIDVFLTQLRVEIISPSDDYDKYFKALYRQEFYGGSPDLPFLSEIVNVHSNIENGVGIFAGYSSTMITIPIE